MHRALTYQAGPETHSAFQDPERQPAGARDSAAPGLIWSLTLTFPDTHRRKHRPSGRMELWRSRKTQAEHKQSDKSQKGEQGRARVVGIHASRPGW